MKIENIGGARLGSGGKQTIEVKNFARTTHDLSKTTKTSMAAGVLVPTYFEPAQVGDVWDIDLNTLTRTVPTIGPIFSTFKQQVDVFFCPVRLYNGLLHNNAVNIGLDMNLIKFPQVNLYPTIRATEQFAENINTSQISSSSLWAYLGLRGLRTCANFEGQATARVSKHICALGPLMYYDIVKNYYSNKQEKEGKFITGKKRLEFKTQLEYARREQSPQGYIYYAIQEGYFPNLQLTQDTTYIFNQLSLDNVIYTNSNLELKFNNAINLSEAVIILYDTQLGSYLEPIPIENAAEQNNFFINWNDGTIRVNKFRDSLIGMVIMGIAFNGVKTANDTEIEIDTFPLENIDDARYYILQNTEKGRTIYFGEMPLEGHASFNKKPYSILNALDENNQLLAKQKMVGLALKTYQSDIFNNWLNTENIERVNNLSRVNVSSNSFTIESLRLAEKTYNMLNRIVLAGGTYEDWLEAVYSEEVPKRVESPIYIGGLSREIMFEEVVSTADTQDTNAGNQPLGTIAGKGIQSENKNGGHINFHVSEPGFIMIITSITPRLDYSQGNKFYTDFISLDDFHKPNLDGIGYEDLMLNRLAWWAESQADGDENSTYSELAVGKIPAWSFWATNYDESYGDFATGESLEYMVNNRAYKPNIENQIFNAQNPIEDLTTYIDPKKSNNAFADIGRGAANFWAQIGQKAIVRRKISAKPINNL